MLESHLHERGYTYLGPNSLYRLTWFEIFRMLDATNLQLDDASGIRPGDLEKFERYNQKLSRNG